MLKIKYKYLNDVANFLLNDVSLKGKKSMHRMRIVNALKEQSRKLAKEERELLKEFANCDEDGEPKLKETGGYDLSPHNAALFKEQQEDLFEEDFILDDPNLETSVKTVKEVVLGYKKELVGGPAIAHAVLMEQFDDENNGTEGEE
ncbi:hypothetical protein J9303_00865 [Bacillaceae bacterium Marseille-Q3522]|nr:hypothetical protein [Bacillaceae bacterium Marseille-Q3522]